MRTVFILNGPNLNLLGQREPEIYGSTTLAEIKGWCEADAKELGLAIDFRQSNFEGEIIEAIELPAKKPKSGDAYLRFIPRTEMDIAVVSCGVNLTIDGKIVIYILMAMFVVAVVVIVAKTVMLARVARTNAAFLDAFRRADDSAFLAPTFGSLCLEQIDAAGRWPRFAGQKNETARMG